MTTLLLDKVSKTFNNMTRAVSQVSVTIDHGEFVTLVGPSGCGKSTLLRMIAGLETVTGGTIAIDGRIVNDVAPKDRDIAMVFQNYALYPHMSVYQNMAFGLKMRKFPKELIRRRVRETAAILGLADLLDRKSKHLSGGQQQRVALGRAIVRHPKLFLFDEPLSNLDAKLRVAMRGELIKLHKRLRATMLYVTHDQVEAMSMGSRLIVLKDGMVQQVGSPLEVYRNPANRFVAGFIGSPSMNFIPCTLELKDNALFLKNEALRIPLPEDQKQTLLGLGYKTGSPVVLGIRPEDIAKQHLRAENASGHRVAAKIEYLEPLGSEILATCRLGENSIVVRLPSDTDVAADDQVELVFNMRRAKLFEPADGKALAVTSAQQDKGLNN